MSVSMRASTRTVSLSLLTLLVRATGGAPARAQQPLSSVLSFLLTDPSFGVSTRIERFSSLDGHDLRDGTFVTSGNQFRDEAQPFDVETLKLDLELRTLELFANVGLTDKLDVGVAVPFESIALVGGSFAMPLADTGLRSRVIAQIGLDYALPR
jgi:hypothetical protein